MNKIMGKTQTVCILLLFAACFAVSFASDQLTEEFTADDKQEIDTVESFDVNVNKDEQEASAERSYHCPRCSIGSNRVRHYWTIGKPKKIISGYSRPFYIQITDDGRVFLTVYGGRSTYLLDQHGNRIRRFSITKGRATGLFVKGNLLFVTNHIRETFIFDANRGHLLGIKYSHEPVGIALDDNDLTYVTEWRTGRIQVFHRDGRKSHSMTIPGRGNRYPRKIQFDSNGNLLVPEFFTSSIHIFSKSGDRRGKIYVPGVKYAEGLFIDSKGYIYLTDRGRGKVHIMNHSGKIVKTIHGFRGASDVTVAPDGTVWVVDFVGNRVYLY